MPESTGSIGSTTMLVCVTFGLPRQSTQLEAEATKIETEKHADKGTVRASAFYFQRNGDKSKGEPKKVDGLSPLKQFQADYKRAVHTLARYDYAGGFKLAPVGVVEELLLLKASFDTKAAEVWTKWADDDYINWWQSAETRMGSMFNKDDFPSLGDCKNRFFCECEIVPLGEADQVKRITLISPHSAQLLEKAVDEKTKKQVEKLQVEIWTDFFTPINKIVDIMSKDKPKIYETLIPNLLEIVNVIPSYDNLTKDSKLAEAAAKAKAVFSQITTDDLRSSADARKLALNTAQSILAEFKPFERKFA